jgi:hypothetical protein
MYTNPDRDIQSKHARFPAVTQLRSICTMRNGVRIRYIRVRIACMYNVEKFKKLVEITTESAYLHTFWIKFGPVSDSILAAFSVSTICMHWHSRKEVRMEGGRTDGQKLYDYFLFIEGGGLIQLNNFKFYPNKLCNRLTYFVTVFVSINVAKKNGVLKAAHIFRSHAPFLFDILLLNDFVWLGMLDIQVSSVLCSSCYSKDIICTISKETIIHVVKNTINWFSWF